MKRMRAAFRTNEPQATAVVMFTLFNLAACLSRDSAPWWLWLFSALIWPSIAFIANLIDPIPPKEHTK